MSEKQQVTALVGADPAALDQALLRSFRAECSAAWNAQDDVGVVAMSTVHVEWRDPTTTSRSSVGRRPAG